MNEVEKVLSFWFGGLDASGNADAAHRERWFRKDPAFDEEIGQAFLVDIEAALAGRRSSWLEHAHGYLAFVIVTDQFPRNVFRGTSRMFAGDPLALAAADDALTRGLDRALAAAPRQFLYMPFMHSEALVDQDRAVALFRALRDGLPPDQGAGAALDYAIRHRDVIARFGRFPHRNETLGRRSTPDELEFLAQPGSSF